MQVNIKMLLFLVFCPVQIVTPYAKTAKSSTKICASILKGVMFPLMVCSNSIFMTKYILALKTPGNLSSEWYLDLKTKHGNYLNYDSFQTNLFFLIQLFWCWAYIECFFFPVLTVYEALTEVSAVTEVTKATIYYKSEG